MILVLLTDDDNGTELIACPDDDAATAVGNAAIWSDGGVSAWRIPAVAITEWEKVQEILRRGEDLSEVNDADLDEVRVDIKVRRK